MRRHIPLITVFVCQVLVAALLLFLHLVTRPTFAEVFRDYAGTIPALARLALSSWYLPALAAFPLVADLIALAMPKRSLRNAALGIGLIVPAFGLVLAAFGMFVPLFESAPAR